MLRSTPLVAQLCHAASAFRESRVVLTADRRQYSYGHNTALQATLVGRRLSAQVAAGRSSAPLFAETVPEFDASIGLVIPARRGQSLCASVGRFYWRGPTAMLLTQQYYESEGNFGVVGTFRRIALSPAITVVPGLAYSLRDVSTRLAYLPRASSQPSDSTARFTLSAFTIGVVVMMDDAAMLKVAVERPFGMPTATRFSPLGRTNGENALTVGFGFAIPKRRVRQPVR